jgi:hypothetical protein
VADVSADGEVTIETQDGSTATIYIETSGDIGSDATEAAEEE